MTRPTLTTRQQFALLEIAHWDLFPYRHWDLFPYRWRQGSMRSLAALGLVRRGGGTDATPWWTITEAGIAWLEGGA